MLNYVSTNAILSSRIVVVVVVVIVVGAVVVGPCLKRALPKNLTGFCIDVDSNARFLDPSVHGSDA